MQEKKEKKDIKKKPSSDKYEDKVSFDGTFDELLKLTVTVNKDKETKKDK